MSDQPRQARELLGSRLRDLRKDAGLTGRALAAACGWHLSKISRIEHGHRAPSEADIRLWCRHCGATDQTDDLIATARGIEAMWLEWRRALRAGTRLRQRRSIGLYDKAETVRAYHPTMIWGTVQTAEYATAVLQQVVDFYGIPDDVEAGVSARMERQQYLYRGDRRFHVLLGEQALYTNLAGPTAQRGQLDRLLTVHSLPRLSLGIIPATAPCPIWPGNAFTIFDDHVVMVETYSAELTLNQPHEVSLYAKAFHLLHGSAVYGEDVRRLITKAADKIR